MEHNHQQAPLSDLQPLDFEVFDRTAASRHAANVRTRQADPRARRIVPISPYSAGPRLLVNGHTYARFADAASAREALSLLREFWPAAQGRLLEIVTA